jgi:lipopolysaccharide export system protein LptA
MTAFPVLLTLSLVVTSAAAAAQRPTRDRCQLEVLSSDREGVREDFQSGVNYFLGGDVHLKCRRQEVYLDADSVASFSGDVVRLITRAHYRDAEMDVTADTLTYISATERLELRGNAVVVNRVNGSTLKSPWIDYLRAVTGVRDSAEVIALQRPTVTYRVARAASDTADPSPYLIVADGMRTRGSSWMVGWGNVLVDREALHGRGDSLLYLRADQDLATLVGAPAHLTRAGADSFAVTGLQVQLGFLDQDLRMVRAHGDGVVRNRVGVVTGDTVALGFAAGELATTRSWRAGGGPATVAADGFDVRGDSIAIDTPQERLRDLWVFRQAVLMQPLDDSARSVVAADSTPPIRNTMTGAAIHAQFVDHDSAGTPVTRLAEIMATGQATSLFSRTVLREGKPSPTINYTRGDTIIVVMKTGDSTGVHEVRAYRGGAPVDGVQLERASLPARPAPAAERPERPATPTREDETP